MSNTTYHIVRKKDLKEEPRNDSFLFHNDEFVYRNEPSNLIAYALYENDRLLAKIYFQIINQMAVSLPQSPFGSFDSVEDIATSSLSNLVKRIITDFKETGIKTISITQFPKCYQTKIYNKISDTLKRNGFTEQHIDITQYIQTELSFRGNIKPSQRRYLNYAEDNKFTFRHLPSAEFNKAYDLIESSRIAKNYPVTMTRERLKDTVDKFNNAYFLFGLFDGKNMVASSVCIAVNNRILYDFYHGDDLRYRKRSVIVPLIYHLAQWAEENGFSLLDIGVSTENGKINNGLYNFKRNLGARDSEKASFILNF